MRRHADAKSISGPLPFSITGYDALGRSNEAQHPQPFQLELRINGRYRHSDGSTISGLEHSCKPILFSFSISLIVYLLPTCGFSFHTTTKS
jgi:hypothetical protein